MRTEDGRAEIQFDDGSILRLAQSSTAELTEFRWLAEEPSTKVEFCPAQRFWLDRINRRRKFSSGDADIDVEVPTGAEFSRRCG